VPDEVTNDEKSYSAPALEKGLDILEALAERSPASVRDLAETLGRSKNEIFRMIHVLIARGYVQRDAETAEIALTNKLFGLGLQTPQSRTLLEAALPEMEKLAAAVDQSPHLVIVHMGRTVILGHSRASSDFTFNLKAGYGRLASDATTGRIILAFQSEDRRRQMLADCDRQSGNKIDRAKLGSALDTIRARGYVLGKSTDFVGITDICCPILDANDYAVAALIIAHIDRVNKDIEEEKLLTAVRTACACIGKRL
jgi:DNA-binding IclR family transcriptional regulator